MQMKNLLFSVSDCVCVFAVSGAKFAIQGLCYYFTNFINILCGTRAKGECVCVQCVCVCELSRDFKMRHLCCMLHCNEVLSDVAVKFPRLKLSLDFLSVAGCFLQIKFCAIRSLAFSSPPQIKDNLLIEYTL